MHTRKLSKIYMCDVHTLSVLIWTAGLTLGIYAGSFICEPLAVSVYRTCFSKSALLIPSAVLPITLVWLASKYAMGGLIYLLLFGKAFLDGAIFLAVGHSFGSAAWLMGIPVLFSDRIATIFFLYYSVCCLGNKHYRFTAWYFAFVLLIIGAILLDYFLISPNFIYLMP